MLVDARPVLLKRLRLIRRYLKRRLPSVRASQKFFDSDGSLKKAARSEAQRLQAVADQLLPQSDLGKASHYFASKWWPWASGSDVALALRPVWRDDGEGFRDNTYEPPPSGIRVKAGSTSAAQAKEIRLFQNWLVGLGSTPTRHDRTVRKSTLGDVQLIPSKGPQRIVLPWVDPQNEYRLTDLIALHRGYRFATKDAASEYVHIPAAADAVTIQQTLIENHPHWVRPWLAVLTQAFMRNHHAPFFWCWKDHAQLLQGRKRKTRLRDTKGKREAVLALLSDFNSYFGGLPPPRAPLLINEGFKHSDGTAVGGTLAIGPSLYEKQVPFDATWLSSVSDAGSAFKSISLLAALIHAWSGAPPMGTIQTNGATLLRHAGYQIAPSHTARQLDMLSILEQQILPHLKEATGLQWKVAPSSSGLPVDRMYTVKPPLLWALRKFWSPPDFLFSTPVDGVPSTGAELPEYWTSLGYTSRSSFSNALAEVTAARKYSFYERKARNLELKDTPLDSQLRRDLRTLKEMQDQSSH